MAPSTTDSDDDVAPLRVGQAAEMLGVTVETLRRWEADGRLRLDALERRAAPRPDRRGRRASSASAGAARRTARSSPSRPATASPGSSPASTSDTVAAVVEVMAGPHRLVSLMTAEAVDDLDLQVGDEAVGVVKATNVIVEIPSAEGAALMKSRRRPARRDPRPASSRRAPAGATSAPTTAPASAAARHCTRPAARRRPASRSTARRRSRRPSPRSRPPTRPRNAGTTLTISTDSSSALETQDRAGRAGRRLPVGRHDEPAEARRQGPRRRARSTKFAGNLLTVIVPTANPAGIRSRWTWPRAGSRSSPPATPCRSRSTRRMLVANLAKESGLPGRLRRQVHGQRRVQGGQRRGRRRQDRARRGRRGHRLRHRCQDLDQGHDRHRARRRPMCRRRMAASS